MTAAAPAVDDSSGADPGEARPEGLVTRGEGLGEPGRLGHPRPGEDRELGIDGHVDLRHPLGQLPRLLGQLGQLGRAPLGLLVDRLLLLHHHQLLVFELVEPADQLGHLGLDGPQIAAGGAAGAVEAVLQRLASGHDRRGLLL